MQHYHTIVIGAGAAGLMCAITSGTRGKSTLVLDHANKAGKKILMSGGGRCNFTNLHSNWQCFISHNPHFCRSALARYTPHDFIDLVQQHNIPFHEKHRGQLFCDNKSKDIVNMLLTELQQAGGTLQLSETINEIQALDDGDEIQSAAPLPARYKINTTRGSYSCHALVIATGGLSIPTMGASGFGYEVAKQFGIKVWPTRAGLVPFTLQPDIKQHLEPLAGSSATCRVQCGQTTFNEDMLFTHRGLSGPAMLQISSYWQPGQALAVDFTPDIDLLSELKIAHADLPKTTLQQFMQRWLTKRMVALWLPANWAQRPLADCSYQLLQDIAQCFQNWCVQPCGTEGYRTAEVTLGGVDTHAICSKTMAAKSQPGLYFIGEVLDVTGWLGGYNFQWAWASAVAAGQAL